VHDQRIVDFVLPHLAAVAVERVEHHPEAAYVVARVRAETVACPACATLSASVRDRYQRRRADGPVGGLPVWIVLRVRRFNCVQRACATRTFVEQVPGLTVRRGRRRATRPVRIRPVPLDQAAVPGQQGGRGDDPVLMQCAGQQPGQRGQHGPIRPGRPHPIDLAAQHGDFVPQHQQLCCLGGIAPGKESEPAEHPNHDQIQQPNCHEPIMR
jgi:hypothetical protein